MELPRSHFSQRSALSVSGSAEDDPVDRLCARYEAEHGRVIDLCASNPTRIGLDYGMIHQDLSDIAAQSSILDYDPHPAGSLAARRAVADYHWSRYRASVEVSRILLTASSSESYTVLFDLLTDPGDVVLVPAPGYPLIDVIAAVSGLTIRSYPLVEAEDGDWVPDFSGMEAAICPKTKVILCISPHNPTGAVLSAESIAALENICERHQLSLVVDEVFRDYAQGPTLQQNAVYHLEVPTFVLNGCSKLALMPQLKLGWMVVGGMPEQVKEAVHRLEHLLDALLSVSAHAQLMLPSLLRAAPALQSQLIDRCAYNHARLSRFCRNMGFQCLPFNGSWYGVIREDARWSGADVSVLLARHCGLRVHPGYFYQMPDAQALVLSLLTQSADFEEGLQRIRGFFE
jgi:aspartate/methionine/tyrosine aminotransferase